MKFIIASTNPVKINAVISAVAKQFPDATVKGLEVESGVSAQPMSDEETKLGSINRASAVRALAIEQKIITAQEEFLCIGLEGGVFHPAYVDNKEELWSTVWATALDQDGKQYFSNGARFPLPDFLSKLLLAGEEMGPALGKREKDPDLRKKEGMIGLITNHFTNRTDEYESIVKIAIGLWYGSKNL
jgi:inosine/xanthosine triphosphatase